MVSTPTTQNEEASDMARKADDPKKTDPEAPHGRKADGTPKKKPGAPKGRPTGKRGVIVVNDLVPWRRKVREARIKLDDVAKEIFLAHYAQNGRYAHAADAADVSCQCVDNHLKDDPEFAEAFEEAKARYRDTFLTHARDLMMGIKEPIVGGKERNEIVGHKVIYPIPLIQMEMRRVEPEYKDKSEVDMKVAGGVLVAPAQCTPEEWVKLHSAGAKGKAAPEDQHDD